ncbi:hypothetical protein BTR22_19230 [Alkalihalophilus pseudofirmus]|uniref:phage late control D family protein n=1 Tax=Alkalihalophilus pseudofirmus TaxID=79885 RepID=UPI000951E33F|nr:hypothetical protein BTR22_19230 [Alkalihalophilus pseudofirmus]
MQARRVLLQVKYQGIDITKTVNDDLVNFSYTDNAAGEADSLSLTLKDDHKMWRDKWFPEREDRIEATIEALDWRFRTDKQELPCGIFYIDQPEYSGPPGQITLGAVSTPTNGGFQNVARSQTWKNIKVRMIANDIAFRAGLGLEFIGSHNPTLKEVEQSEETDSSFLAKLCEDEGLAMKVTDRKIIIYSESEFEKKAAVTTYDIDEDRVLDYSFRRNLSTSKYDGCRVKYTDPTSGRTREFTYMIDQITPTKDARIYRLTKKVNSQEEARRAAINQLRKLNKHEYEASLTVVGHLQLVGTVCIMIENAGSLFNGKYFIRQAAHSVGSGYTTRIEARKIMEGL